jgi:hypothetical protein
MKWLENYATANPVAYSILLVSLVAVVGLGFATVKIRGVGLGVTGVLFAGLIFGHFGFHLEHHTMEFLREFGLILFVFTIGLQIGPLAKSLMAEKGNILISRQRAWSSLDRFSGDFLRTAARQGVATSWGRAACCLSLQVTCMGFKGDYHR